MEHTAEPTGNILHMHPMVSFGDPEGMERIMKSARTFAEFFLAPKSGSPLGHRHFQDNHMSSTQIATNPNHRADIPLNGRVTGPFSFLLWYSGNPGVEIALLTCFEADPLLCTCGGRMRIVSFITDPHVVDRILRHRESKRSKAQNPLEPRPPPLAVADSPQ